MPHESEASPLVHFWVLVLGPVDAPGMCKMLRMPLSIPVSPKLYYQNAFPSRDEVLDVNRIACFAQYWICLENIYIYQYNINYTTCSRVHVYVYIYMYHWVNVRHLNQIHADSACCDSSEGARLDVYSLLFHHPNRQSVTRLCLDFSCTSI